MSLLSRRALIAGSSLLLPGCDALIENNRALAVAQSAELATQRWQRLIGHNALAREFTAADISPVFKANGTINPTDPGYQAHAANNFQNWRLKVRGLVKNPLSLSLQDLQNLPARSQITRHDCVEGWSAIGGWSGPPLGLLLSAADVAQAARYVIFLCADTYRGTSRYYESIDLIDAWHPQTILALRLNNRPLDIAHGAPVRLRVERQLGYKHAKYVEDIILTASLDGFGEGAGGYWEDRGYEWYAGI